MLSSEELREALVESQRDLVRLRTEATHATLLINALEALLIDPGSDPFANVFPALHSVFEFSHALVLVERAEGDDRLVCAVADPPELVDSTWPVGRLFRKVLGGRVAATLSNLELDEWAGGSALGLSPQQPSLYLPMRVRERRGLMMLLRPVAGAGFDRSDVALARKFALLASHALAARHAHQSEAETQRLRSLTDQLLDSQRALAHRANHDQLTELPNRSRMQELAERALGCQAGFDRVAIAFLDLDGFKQVNDFYSHGVGDALLRAVAARLQASVRPCDVVGRISGDEFLVLLQGVDGPGEVEAIVAGALHALRRPFTIDGVEISTSASIGVALSPEHGTDYETLRRNADTAMYKAKAEAKGSLAIFDSEMGHQAAIRLKLEQQLREAIRERQFRCAFQSKVDLATMRIVGFEALARWVDGAGRVRGPHEFIAAASEFQLLNEITRLIVKDAIASLPALDALFGAETRISINVSARQASDPFFMTSFVADLAAGERPERFTVEVTEDAFVTASVFQREVLPMLRRLGVSVSIDDFGTGYSSLSALTDIPADELKVDRSFISSIQTRPRSQSILKAIESLGRALGMVIVAEGVETEDELDYLLTTTSIRMAQGYYFSKPRLLEHILAPQPLRNAG